MEAAYKEGAAARKMGSMANPYFMKDTLLAAEWHRGWIGEVA